MTYGVTIGKGNQHFASRLPEPQEEQKICRFERILFCAKASDKSDADQVDYVSLSDGEHQLTQILGMMCMLSTPNILFLLDEPESHFNPEWRVKFISRLLQLPTQNGVRKELGNVAQQECILTTHAPFVPSDMSRERVIIFEKQNGSIKARNPSNETFGATFDGILRDCFNVHPPISQIPREEIDELMKSNNRQAVLDGMKKLGHSVEKVFLADHLRR